MLLSDALPGFCHEDHESVSHLSYKFLCEVENVIDAYGHLHENDTTYETRTLVLESYRDDRTSERLFRGEISVGNLK